MKTSLADAVDHAAKRPSDPFRESELERVARTICVQRGRIPEALDPRKKEWWARYVYAAREWLAVRDILSAAPAEGWPSREEVAKVLCDTGKAALDDDDWPAWMAEADAVIALFRARQRESVSRDAHENHVLHLDLCELLHLLGMGDHARAQSPHEVFQEALGVLRSRLASQPQGGGAPAGWAGIVEHLRRQREWSGRTFGPGSRAKGVVDHIRKELHEIEANPTDLSEWIDVVILAMDGAWRSGATPEEIVEAWRAKQAKNEARSWPDWRTMSPDQAIEHVRAAAPLGNPTSVRSRADD